ncbi:class I adenylate-forming enzyme family protein [Luminiphilus sp. nBUS_07]|uniref:class I adenylate-forming enzyme family protein n=1 Tax=Luminiphilus sp. nBUS_07 TaxID=3395314 RepID=UPI003EBCCBB4
MMASDSVTIAHHSAKGWWGNDTLDAHFRRNVAAYPERLAILDPPNRLDIAGSAAVNLTYSELAERVEAQVRQLYYAGVRRNDIVVLQLPNIHEITVILLACARMGVILSPVVMQFDRSELRDIFSQLSPTAYITLSRFKGRDMATAESLQDLCGEFNVKLLSIDGPADDRSILDASQQDLESSPTAANEALTICWTSGTEGKAKGVIRSHNLWAAIGRMVAHGAKMQDGDVILNARPMVNMAAIGGGFYCWLLSSGTLALHHPLDMPMVLDQIRRLQVTVTFMPPAFIVALLKDPELRAQADLTSLRIMGSGSAALPDWVVEEMADNFGVEIVNFFGSNEGVSLQSTRATVPDSSLRSTHFARAGRADISWSDFELSRELETKIVDLDSGEEITEPGKKGQLLMRGSTIFSYYFNAPEQTAAAFDSEGFYRSGDLFEIAGDSSPPRYYKYVGRCREVIIRGGFNIAPAEIDNLLSDHPAILEVAAFAVPDERLGERTGVAVVMKPQEVVGLDDLLLHLTAKHIATYKLPERLLVVPSLPRNAMQKVVRQELTAMFTAAASADAREVLIE